MSELIADLMLRGQAGTPASPPELDDLLLPLLPLSLRSEREDWLLRSVAPHFVRSFSVIGEVCVFGCLPQVLATPLAFLVRALRMPRSVYAFDTFDSEARTDWTGLPVSGEAVYDDLVRWSAAIPVRPVRGAPAETSKILFERIAFAWFDLNSAELVESVLDTIWPLLATRTSIGIGCSHAAAADLEAWAASKVAAGTLRQLTRAQPGVVGFYAPAAG